MTRSAMLTTRSTLYVDHPRRFLTCRPRGTRPQAEEQGADPRAPVMQTLRKYLEDEHLQKKKTPIDLSEWVNYWDDVSWLC